MFDEEDEQEENEQGVSYRITGKTDNIKNGQMFEEKLHPVKTNESYKSRPRLDDFGLPGDTPTEKVIWLCLKLGWSNTAIAEAFGISTKTVTRLRHKLEGLYGEYQAQFFTSLRAVWRKDA